LNSSAEILDSDLFIPIVMGVTGHRDLRDEDLPHLRESVAGIFHEIRSVHPQSPIVLLSPLADGADRLVAEVALDCGTALVVPLPMPLEEYLTGFESQESRRHFQSLLKKARNTFEVSPGHQANQAGDTHSAGINGRYAAMGAFLARSSPLLLALWDGTLSHAEGGTSDIVRLRLGLRSLASPACGPLLAQEETGPVYHIITPRKENPSPAAKPYSVQFQLPSLWGSFEEGRMVYARSLENIERFNRDAKVHFSQRDLAAISAAQVIGKPLADSLGTDCRLTLRRYAIADTLARIFKRKRVVSLVVLLVLAVLAFFSFHVYLDFFHDRPVFLLAYPALLAIATLWYVHAKRRGFEYKHEDYRALAEAMRIQLFWKIAGIDAQASDYYLHKHKGELEWIRLALRGWNSLSPPHRCSSTANSLPPGDTLRLLATDWLENQRAWFERRSRDNHLAHRILEIAGNSFLFLGAVCALVLYALQTADALPVVRHYAPIAIVMSLALAGAIHWIVEKLAFQEQTKQYARMAILYRDASGKFQERVERNDLEGARGLLLELGREALREGADWLWLHRARPLEMPRT
jgi:hypothetical protein